MAKVRVPKPNDVSVEWVRHALAEGSVTRKEAASLLVENVQHSLTLLSEGISTAGRAQGKEDVSRLADRASRDLSPWYKPDGELGVFVSKALAESPLPGVAPAESREVSPAAATLLQPFAQQLQGLRVLELNCEGGARTRFLAECGAAVTAVTAKPQDALATAALCSGRSNVQVVVDSPQALPFRGLFDLVILAGYQEEFIAGAEVLNPLNQLLSRSYSALAPNGTLLMAGHNALALRHFNDQRDAYGREGVAALEGRFSAGEPQLWSASSMRRAITEAGFKQQVQCALMGTVERPNLLVSPLGWELPADRWNLETLVRRSLAGGDSGRLARFSESRVLSAVMQCGALTDWSDGYVFLAHKSAEPWVTLDGCLASAFKPSDESDAGGETRFMLGAEGGALRVEKYSLGDVEVKAVSSYINGLVYRDQVDDLLQVPGWTFEQLLHWSAIWLRCLLGSLNNGDSLTPNGEQAAAYTGQYDLWVPDRFFLATSTRWIQCGDGSSQCLQDTLSSKGTAPMAMVLYAGLLSTFATLRSVAEPADSAWLAPVALAKAVVGRLGYSFPEEDLEALTTHWQHVTNTPLPAPAHFAAREKPRALTDKAKLYWATESEGFSESKTSTATLALDGSAQVLRLAIATPDQPVTALRFDVANRPGCIEIERMAVMQANGELLWQWDHTREALSGVKGATLVVDRDAGYSCVLSRGNDPQFALNLPEPALTSAAGGVLEVRLSAWSQRL